MILMKQTRTSNQAGQEAGNLTPTRNLTIILEALSQRGWNETLTCGRLPLVFRLSEKSNLAVFSLRVGWLPRVFLGVLVCGKPMVERR